MAFDELWRHPVRGSDDCVPLHLLVRELCCEAKVRELDFTRVTEQDVVRLDVPVEAMQAVDVAECLQCLDHDIGHLGLRQADLLLEDCGEGAARHVLEDDPQLVITAERINELHNVRVLALLLDVNLGDEVLDVLGSDLHLLDGNLPVVPAVGGGEHFSERPLADLAHIDKDQVGVTARVELLCLGQAELVRQLAVQEAKRLATLLRLHALGLEVQDIDHLVAVLQCIFFGDSRRLEHFGPLRGEAEELALVRVQADVHAVLH
mmetsp:Transcript_17726/g.68758  ORF Transcript_17726/g.68758 Transcript_17726/m.68758 type:complete len:263 (+) Transcript_17726:394-1182(+)